MSFRQPCERVEATPRDGTTAQLFSLETSQAVQSYSTAVGIRLGLRPPGPHGSGGVPPLGSFAGLRSRSLISFFVFLVLFLIHVPCFVSCLSVLWSVSVFTDVLRKILRSLTRKVCIF